LPQEDSPDAAPYFRILSKETFHLWAIFQKTVCRSGKQKRRGGFQFLVNHGECIPALKPHLTKSNGEYRSFVNLFLGEINIRDLQGFETELDEADELRLVSSIAGG